MVILQQKVNIGQLFLSFVPSLRTVSILSVIMITERVRASRKTNSSVYE